MKLVVGLGNPGSEYVGTRHNVGFDVIEQFAVRNGWIEKPEQYQRLAKQKFDGLLIDGVMQTQAGGSEKIVLLEPVTFMNVSGKAVTAAMAFYNVFPQDLLIVLDHLALPVGKLRLRPGGTSGGHNGLKDIERVLATNQYPRLRLGIDKPQDEPEPVRHRMAGKDYVLARFTPSQKEILTPAIARACGAIATWVDQGIATAMNRFNQKDEG